MKLYNIVNFRKLKKCGDLTERTRLFTGYACNIKCKFCFYKNNKHIGIKDKIYQQLEQGRRFGIKDWDISGGEPPILPYWFEILDKMKKMGFRNIACITNGYKFADINFLKESKKRGLNELLFSLHGNSEKIHDSMTGVEGSFHNLITAIDNAKQHDIKIRINVVVTKDNYKNLLLIAKYANEIQPVAFNFLPFRMENSASKNNMIRYSEIAPYIKKSINILDDNIKVAIRYVPFCLFKNYEKYIAGYLQRAFDEYEWNEYTIRNFDIARFNKDIQPLDCQMDKWELEINAIHNSIKHVANHTTSCLRCKYLKVCDGIWKSYSKVWGVKEFKPIEGNKTECILP
jgi:MoaA/NifB/PqqE/SkfB family radical SAM enzyme